jgi:hypothetical protein
MVGVKMVMVDRKHPLGGEREFPFRDGCILSVLLHIPRAIVVLVKHQCHKLLVHPPVMLLGVIQDEPGSVCKVTLERVFSGSGTCSCTSYLGRLIDGRDSA